MPLNGLKSLADFAMRLFKLCATVPGESFMGISYSITLTDIRSLPGNNTKRSCAEEPR
jgi:hypothetical protein